MWRRPARFEDFAVIVDLCNFHGGRIEFIAMERGDIMYDICCRDEFQRFPDSLEGVFVSSDYAFRVYMQ